MINWWIRCFYYNFNTTLFSFFFFWQSSVQVTFDRLKAGSLPPKFSAIKAEAGPRDLLVSSVMYFTYNVHVHVVRPFYLITWIMDPLPKNVRFYEVIIPVHVCNSLPYLPVPGKIPSMLYPPNKMASGRKVNCCCGYFNLFTSGILYFFRSLVWDYF